MGVAITRSLGYGYLDEVGRYGWRGDHLRLKLRFQTFVEVVVQVYSDVDAENKQHIKNARKLYKYLEG